MLHISFSPIAYKNKAQNSNSQSSYPKQQYKPTNTNPQSSYPNQQYVPVNTGNKIKSEMKHLAFDMPIAFDTLNTYRDIHVSNIF